MNENNTLVTLMDLVSENARFTPASYRNPWETLGKSLHLLMLFFLTGKFGKLRCFSFSHWTVGKPVISYRWRSNMVVRHTTENPCDMSMWFPSWSEITEIWRRNCNQMRGFWRLLGSEERVDNWAPYQFCSSWPRTYCFVFNWFIFIDFL